MTLQNEDRTVLIKHYIERAQESLKDSYLEANSATTRVSRAYYSAFYCATALLLTKKY